MSESLKVQSQHLERSAYLYIRQSSMRQVIENVESTKRQYALRSRAIALGWRDRRQSGGVVLQVPVAMRSRLAGTPSQSSLRAAVYLMRVSLMLGLTIFRRRSRTPSNPEAPS